MNIPVLALSQLSRSLESRPNKKPLLSDLRESGSIEQEADLVMFIYREAYYKMRSQPKEGTQSHEIWQNEMEEIKNKAELILSKHRNGAIGTVNLCFDEYTTKFHDIEDGLLTNDYSI
jgi:replicative DNA helicase